MIEIIVFVAALTAIALYALKWGMKAPKPYRDRGCMGKEWRSVYPNSSKEEIRLFLECLVDGMAFGDPERLKFQPSDEVLDIYKSIYGGRVPFGDSMECETFLLNLQRKFEVPEDQLSEVWHVTVTLGELFSFVATQQGVQGAPSGLGRPASPAAS